MSNTVGAMLEFMLDMQDWAAEAGLEAYLLAYWRNVHRVQFHNDFYNRFPLAGRGNWTATSCMSRLLPAFFESEGFSAVWHETSGAFVEGFVYHMSNVDPRTADAFIGLFHAKHELDKRLRVTDSIGMARSNSPNGPGHVHRAFPCAKKARRIA